MPRSVIDGPLTLAEKACLPRRAFKWRPVFVRMARDYARAGITSERALGRAFRVSTQTIRDWREAYPAFDEAIESGADGLAVEMTSIVVDAARDGDARLALDILKLRGEAWKPKAALDHTSNGETLSALLAQHGAMSDKEAIDKGLIIDHEAEESESPRRARRHLQD
jgi:hypothetical protein